MNCYLGVDGGNTKTLAVVIDDECRIRGFARTGPSDLHNCDYNVALEAIKKVSQKAISSSGCQCYSAAFCLAGVDWPEDADQAKSALAHLAPIVSVRNDCYGALRAGVKLFCGIAIVCGTYGACAGRGPTGSEWHTGFWSSGEGGGSEIGKEAIKAIVEAELGISGSTRLKELVLQFTKTRSVEELLRLVNKSAGESVFGTLAPVVLDAASAGDERALYILRSQGTTVGKYAVATARKVGIGGEVFSLVVGGGVCKEPQNPVSDAAVEYVKSQLPNATCVPLRLEPAIGAAVLALEQAGRNLSDLEWRRLEEMAHKINFG